LFGNVQPASLTFAGGDDQRGGFCEILFFYCICVVHDAPSAIGFFKKN
jgi:hypothetical protein